LCMAYVQMGTARPKRELVIVPVGYSLMVTVKLPSAIRRELLLLVDQDRELQHNKSLDCRSNFAIK